MLQKSMLLQLSERLRLYPAGIERLNDRSPLGRAELHSRGLPEFFERMRPIRPTLLRAARRCEIGGFVSQDNSNLPAAVDAWPPPPPGLSVSQPQGHADARAFQFDGGAGTYLGTAILALLITVVSLGLALPFALVLRQRWQCKHTFIEGRRLKFTGTGVGLFGNWLKWVLLILVTLGIYSFWVAPKVTKWIVEHQEFDLSPAARS